MGLLTFGMNSFFDHESSFGAHGFTLLEVMIAVAIIAITFVTLLGSQSQSVSVAAQSRFLTTASLLAQRELTRLQATDFAAIMDDAGDFGEEYPGYSWVLNVHDLTEEESGLPGSTNSLKLLDLSILLGEGGRYTYSVEYLVKK